MKKQPELTAGRYPVVMAFPERPLFLDGTFGGRMVSILTSDTVVRDVFRKLLDVCGRVHRCAMVNATDPAIRHFDRWDLILVEELQYTKAAKDYFEDCTKEIYHVWTEYDEKLGGLLRSKHKDLSLGIMIGAAGMMTTNPKTFGLEADFVNPTYPREHQERDAQRFAARVKRQLSN